LFAVGVTGVLQSADNKIFFTLEASLSDDKQCTECRPWLWKIWHLAISGKSGQIWQISAQLQMHEGYLQLKVMKLVLACYQPIG